MTYDLGYDDSPPAIYNASTPVARKRHYCCECSRAIEPGEQYYRVDGLWDGMWGSYATCADCERVWERYFGHYREHEMLEDMLRSTDEDEAADAQREARRRNVKKRKESER